MKKLLLFILPLLYISSCSVKNISYSKDIEKPSSDFDYSINSYPLDYTQDKNWSYKPSFYDSSLLLPKNYRENDENHLDVSVFYIHPTTLYSSSNWNADTLHFIDNSSIKLCLENQASVFAGITDLYAPHYREMHIHSYTDTINGFKAYDLAYSDVINAFKFFINNKKTDKYIIASHSQGTNHATRLINEYISKDFFLLDNLILSYLIGMDVNKKNISIPVCQSEDDLYCFLTWRSFNEKYYPKKWKYGDDIYSVNPITFSLDSAYSNKRDHLGILLPNKKIVFKKSISVANKSGLLWVRFNNLFLNRYRDNSYHKADYNLFWVNIRENLIGRLSNFD